MRAAVINSIGGPFEVETVQIDAPVGFEVLLDVKACGLCHSDLHSAKRSKTLVPPVVLGHEVAGIVRQVGPAVTEFSPGDHVVACVVRTCGRCDRCRTGKPYQCLDPNYVARPAGAAPRLHAEDREVAQYFGVSGFAEQALIHENQLVKVPEELPFDKACLLGCGVVTGAGVVINTARVGFGDTVAVFGCGGVGLNAVQAARHIGASTIIAVDLQPEKLELARRFGATHVVNPADGDTVEQIRALTGGMGVDAAFEIIGLKQTALQALACVNTGGRAYLVGLQRPDDRAEIDLDADLLRGQKGLSGVMMGSTNPKHDIPIFADLYLQGRWNLDDLVSHRIGLDQINEAYAELDGGGVARSVVVF